MAYLEAARDYLIAPPELAGFERDWAASRLLLSLGLFKCTCYWLKPVLEGHMIVALSPLHCKTL